MRSPTGYRDYMSYCAQSWVSDFGWEKTFDTIVELTSWDAGGAPKGDDVARPIVVGAWTPGGGARWYTTVGTVPRHGGDAVVEFAAGGATVREPAATWKIPDSDAVAVVAALPAAPFGSLTFKTGGKIRAHASAGAVVQLH
jgi:hypothetical protein